MTQRHFALQVTVGSVLFAVLVALVIHQLRTPAAVPPRQPALEQLARYGPAPDFSLVERSGSAVSARDLRGQVWIADFIYTKCQDTCPLQSRAMATLQSDLKAHGEVRSVSITVDPLTDTPRAAVAICGPLRGRPRTLAVPHRRAAGDPARRAGRFSA